MPTRRGFVEAIEIGRAGQAAATVLHEHGSRTTYVLADLDADPERFNERLSKLGLLRDAMDRAEPVEIEFRSDDNAGDFQTIERVRRLARDALRPTPTLSSVTGSVVGVRLDHINRPDSPAEASDRATIALMVGQSVRHFTIDLQIPERGTAETMVAMARQAQADGRALTLAYDAERRLVYSVEDSDQFATGEDQEADMFDGFVELIGHTQDLNLALVQITTAPMFEPDGNLVPLVPFTPEPRLLLVLRGAPEYAVFEAALRDKLRIRVFAQGRRDQRDEDPTGGRDDVIRDDNGNVVRARAGLASVRSPASAQRFSGPLFFVRGAILLAPLCSAARPVWVRIDRQALDIGPDADCPEGLPSHDLRPRSLREMDLPYTAEWIGLGCFNHGVYRFELPTAVPVRIEVDGQPLCVHEDADHRARFAHACLDGEHQVRIVLEGWSCRHDFAMDVYRIR